MTTSTDHVTDDIAPLIPTGPFDLAASVDLAAQAGFARAASRPDGSVELVLTVEDSWAPVAVRVVQQGTAVAVTVLANPDRADRAAIRVAVAQVLTLDTDGTGLASVLAGDDRLATLPANLLGVRPVQFPHPFEAAARAIIGHRISMAQAGRVHQRIAERDGRAVELAGGVVWAFPEPARLADLAPVQGLAARKVEQLRGLGRAAADGALRRADLRALPRDEALAHLCTLAGVGPFSAELIMLRGAGDPDLFPRTEHVLHRAMTARHDLPAGTTTPELVELARRWRPYRSWIGLMLRHA